MRFLLAVIIIAVCLGCSPDKPASSSEPAVPSYSGAQVYGLRFKGIGLGMSSAEVCAKLMQQGFVRRPQERSGDPCRADRLKSGSSDDYFGEAVFRNFRDGRQSDTDSVHHISVTYHRSGSSLRAVAVRAHTQEPNKVDELIDATTREWGKPTHFERHGYAILGYAGAASHAHPTNIHEFTSCRLNAACEYKRNKTDCDTVLLKFRNPRAKVAIYDWGRAIEIEDNRPYVTDLAASGWFERRAWKRGAVCPVPRVH